jgi:hypothetical protein
MELMWPKVSLIHAVDETDKAPATACTTQKQSRSWERL